MSDIGTVCIYLLVVCNFKFVNGASKKGTFLGNNCIKKFEYCTSPLVNLFPLVILFFFFFFYSVDCELIYDWLIECWFLFVYTNFFLCHYKFSLCLRNLEWLIYPHKFEEKSSLGFNGTQQSTLLFVSFQINVLHYSWFFLYIFPRNMN